MLCLGCDMLSHTWAKKQSWLEYLFQCSLSALVGHVISAEISVISFLFWWWLGCCWSALLDLSMSPSIERLHLGVFALLLLSLGPLRAFAFEVPFAIVKEL